MGLYDFFDRRLVSPARGGWNRGAAPLPEVEGAWAMVGDSYEQDALPALPLQKWSIWICGGWANRIAGPKAWEPHPKLRRIGHIRELAGEI